jgi:hypothetical protein
VAGVAGLVDEGLVTVVGASKLGGTEVGWVPLGKLSTRYSCKRLPMFAGNLCSPLP